MLRPLLQGLSRGGIETGFLLWVSGVICGMQKRNPVSGVLGFWGYPWGYRNRVSAVGIRGYLWDAEKKPGFWGCCFYQLSVF